MSDMLLVVVYDQDLPQFDVMSWCLNCNWQGYKNITVVYQGDIGSTVLDVVAKNFSADWQVNCVNGDSLAPNLSGYDQQQVQKIIFSIQSGFEHVIVFDCKDFLLKPANSNLFKKDNKFLYVPTVPNDTFSNFYPVEFAAIKTPSSSPDIVPVLILTPWIWNTSQLTRYWNHVLNIFGNIPLWKIFPPISELASFYYFCSAIDGDPISTYSTDQFMPMGGVWDSESTEQRLQNAKNFDRFDSTVVWKHHRRINDIGGTVVTALQLQKYGVPANIIAKWAENKHNILL